MHSNRFLIVSLLLAFIVLPFTGRADFESPLASEGSDSIPAPDALIFVPDSLLEFYEYASSDTILRLAVVLSDIYSKKDMEFTRGLLMGVRQSGMPESSLSLKVINGEIPEDSLQYELDLFGPHVIFSTFEKDAPRTLRSYTQENGNSLFNIFDARSDDYLYNDKVFQLLAPTDRFNAEVSDFIMDNFPGNVLILVGDPDPTDSSIRDLIISWPEEDLMILSKEDLDVFIFEEERNYLVYPLFTSNDDVKEVVAKTVRLAAETPSAGVRIFGRPNWIAFSDLPSMISNMEVYVPAKCYFDPSAAGGRRFIKGYNAMFGHAPIRSYPVYAVMGFDTAKYFLPRLLQDLRGELFSWEPEIMEQSYFDLRKSFGGGFYNQGGFILHYEPWGTMTREPLGDR